MFSRLDIYIDGSHLDKQNNGRLGIGGVIVRSRKDKTPMKEFSTELKPEFMKLNFGSDKCSNPSAELMALLVSLSEFSKEITKTKEVVVHADYIGVKEWMTGGWKIKEPYIQKIKDRIDEDMRRRFSHVKFFFEWIRGHQTNSSDHDVYWNNYVDRLAKGWIV